MRSITITNLSMMTLLLPALACKTTQGRKDAEPAGSQNSNIAGVADPVSPASPDANTQIGSGSSKKYWCRSSPMLQNDTAHNAGALIAFGSQSISTLSGLFHNDFGYPYWDTNTFTADGYYPSPYPFGVILEKTPQGEISLTRVSASSPYLPKALGPNFKFSIANLESRGEGTSFANGRVSNVDGKLQFKGSYNCSAQVDGGQSAQINEITHQPGGAANVCFSKLSADQVLDDQLPNLLGAKRNYVVSFPEHLLNDDPMALNQDGGSAMRIFWFIPEGPATIQVGIGSHSGLRYKRYFLDSLSCGYLPTLKKNGAFSVQD